MVIINSVALLPQRTLAKEPEVKPNALPKFLPTEEIAIPAARSQNVWDEVRVQRRTQRE